jgi:hypothetical protein
MKSKQGRKKETKAKKDGEAGKGEKPKSRKAGKGENPAKDQEKRKPQSPLADEWKNSRPGLCGQGGP